MSSPGVCGLHPRMASHLLRAAPLVRPLVQREWALAVGAYDAGLVGDDLDEFLFGVARLSLQPVRTGRREAAGGRCFYCCRPGSAVGATGLGIPFGSEARNALATSWASSARDS